MQQILQNLANGEISLVDVPCPIMKTNGLLIQTNNSLISPGTERMLLNFGKANYIDKIRQQPDKVKTVIEKAKTDGILPTIAAVRTKLDQPIALGYCNAGVILESDVDHFSIGDRVASNGYHAEVVTVGKNLCVKIPDEIDDQSASFTVIGSIALESIRLINPNLGDTVVVFGLGLIGLLTVQMLKTNGCRVLGIDYNTTRCGLAESFGAQIIDLSKIDNPTHIARNFSRGRGVDAVIIATTSKSDEVIHQAANMCRQRGEIVLVGTSGLNLRRDDFYEKEISFKVSCSYGPGRYDSSYEDKGIDYPVGFVRWTEQRNFEAVLDMMANRSLDVKPLITHTFKIDDAIAAYNLLNDPSAMGVVLDYPSNKLSKLKSSLISFKSENNVNYKSSDSIVGFIGAGNYASRILIPAFKSTDAKLDTLITSGGVSGVHHGKKAGFRVTSTDIKDLLENDQINTTAIATRHNLHAEQIKMMLNAGKNVFVEKPLALTLKEIDDIQKTFMDINSKRENKLHLMVGFNRRFSPHIAKMKSLLNDYNEVRKSIVITVNAGEVPADHWVHDPHVGGGRIIGEGCHFIDLMRFLVGAPISGHQAMMMGSSSNQDITNDKVSIGLTFSDGSFGTIHYLSNGGKLYPKERVEVFCNNAVLQMDNYRILKGYSWPGFRKYRLFSQDKGQKACVKAFIKAVKEGQPTPIPFDEIIEISRIAIQVVESLKEGK